MRRDKQSMRIGIMFRLRNEVPGDAFGRGGLIRENNHLRRTGDEIDSGSIGVRSDLPLRGGHKAVSGSEHFVDAGHRFRPVGHGGNRLDASDGVDLAQSDEVRCREYDRIDRTAGSRRRTKDNTRASGEKGGDAEHEDGRRERR